MISHDCSPLSLPLCKSGVVLFMVELYHGIPSMSIGFICICLKFLLIVLNFLLYYIFVSKNVSFLKIFMLFSAIFLMKSALFHTNICYTIYRPQKKRLYMTKLSLEMEH